MSAYVVADGAALVRRAWAEGLRRPPRMSVSEWADRFRRLPTKGASEPGLWRTLRVPYTREIMDCLSADHPARRVSLMKSVQSAGTEIGLNWVGSVIHLMKVPMMCVQPTIEMGERWSKQRLAAMIEDCPELRERIAPARSRDSGNTTLLKEWPGGVLIISGANSTSSLRSMPARFLFADEVDDYPFDLDDEGDPLSLAEARTTTFPRRKVFIVSTPTIESLSRINQEWLSGDMRRFHVPCPHCGEVQILTWEHLTWPAGKPKEAAYACSANGCLIEEHHKTAMLAAGEWRAEHPERFDETRHASFHVNALYAPTGLGFTWAELAAEYDAKRNDPVKLKTFQNLRLGICTADPTEKVDYEELQKRAETGHKLRTLPPGCLVLTAAVDVQKDRFAVLIVGWGRGGVRWIIDWVELPADPQTDDGWKTAWAYLAQPLQNSRGTPIRIRMTAVDCGYLQDDVLAHTKGREAAGIIAVKGHNQTGKPIIARPTFTDYTFRGSVHKSGGKLWMTGTDGAKEKLFLQMIADRERLPVEQMVRFPQGLDESFYSQLTAEVWDPNKRRWVKVRDRNEALDTMCYAVTAAHHPLLRLYAWKEPQWAALEAALEPAVPDLFSQPAPAPAAAPVPVPAQKQEVRNAPRRQDDWSL